ncbi:MAG: TRIC cation channel family protein [Bacillota bacterium]|nr:TRIC cation channel family protein [Bacillota bacterium]
METLIFLLEIVGTVAFTFSGAMTGLKKKMDIFGVVILGLTTAVGGGIIRDLTLGITPPKTFQNPVYALISIFTAILIFIPGANKYLTRNRTIYERILFIMDTLGLGVFTVTGIYTAYEKSNGFNCFLLVFVGVITGVGGGVLRDLLAGNTPYIFVKHVYACASIAGAVICVLMWHNAGSTFSMLTGIAVIVLLRFLSAYFKWNLPRAGNIE